MDINLECFNVGNKENEYLSEDYESEKYNQILKTQEMSFSVS